MELRLEPGQPKSLGTDALVALIPITLSIRQCDVDKQICDMSVRARQKKLSCILLVTAFLKVFTDLKGV